MEQGQSGARVPIGRILGLCDGPRQGKAGGAGALCYKAGARSTRIGERAIRARVRSEWAQRAGGGLCLAALALAVPPRAAAGLDPVGIALVVAFLILSLSIHEAAHAWVAWKRGDSTAHDLGRITL